MILNDRQIRQAAPLQPLVPKTKTNFWDSRILSYGQSSFGYDIRLAPNLLISKPIASVLDPKNFDSDSLETATLQHDLNSDYFVMPPYSSALGVSVEYFEMPSDLAGVVLGKSSYARCNIIVNCTLIEPDWRGYLTIELVNNSPNAVRIYAHEGIAQVLFFRGDTPSVGYGDGKYQDQSHEPTPTKM